VFSAHIVLPDGRLASGANDSTIRLWDLTTLFPLPRRPILGPTSVDDHQRQRVATINYRTQHFLGGAVNPVKVFDEHHHRRQSAASL
jgi:WD40 repeat protein